MRNLQIFLNMHLFLRNVQSSIYIPGMCGHAAHAGFHLYLGNVLVLLQNRMGCILSATQPNHISQSETIIKSSSPSSSYNHYHHHTTIIIIKSNHHHERTGINCSRSDLFSWQQTFMFLIFLRSRRFLALMFISGLN